MSSSNSRSAHTLRLVLRFTFRLWTRHRVLAGGIALAMCIATVTEIFIPLYAGRLIDSLAGASVSVGSPSQADAVLMAFGIMAALGLAMVVLRHLSWWGIVPLTLGMMKTVASDSFHRVQRFSTDWHANSFAGSTVRKITRGMWAIDSHQRRVAAGAVAIARRLIGTMLLLGRHWPVMGVRDGSRGAGLCRFHRYARHATRGARLTPVECAGHSHRRCARGCARLECRRQGFRRGSARRRAADACARQMVAAARIAPGCCIPGAASGQLALLWLVRSAVTGDGILAVVAWTRDAGRSHLCAYLVLRRARLFARHRSACASPATRRQ